MRPPLPPLLRQPARDLARPEFSVPWTGCSAGDGRPRCRSAGRCIEPDAADRTPPRLAHERLASEEMGSSDRRLRGRHGRRSGHHRGGEHPKLASGSRTGGEAARVARRGAGFGGQHRPARVGGRSEGQRLRSFPSMAREDRPTRCGDEAECYGWADGRAVGRPRRGLRAGCTAAGCRRGLRPASRSPEGPSRPDHGVATTRTMDDSIGIELPEDRADGLRTRGRRGHRLRLRAWPARRSDPSVLRRIVATTCG